MMGLGGCVELIQARDEMEVEVNALDLQRQQGWNVGQAGVPLELPGASALDVRGSQSWRDALSHLPELLAPAQAELLPYYVPTLFQAASAPTGADLRAQLQPMITAEMADAFGRGQAVAALFGQIDWPTDTAVIVDLPGPLAVAVAAGMADRFEPLFTFDNWPHPLGVVPSHQTLAATLYYLPLFTEQRAQRRQPAPAVFVLDANRLAPYTDADSEFDNRYLAKLPTADGFARLGIRHLLYVTADGAHLQELDDLNDDFVAYDQASIDLKMIALSDFAPSNEPPPEEQPAGYAVWWHGSSLHYYWGGSWWWHCHFWDVYGRPCPPGAMPPTRPSHVAYPPPVHVSRAALYRPALRTTRFGGVVAAGPTYGYSHAGAIRRFSAAGVGRVEVRQSRWDGRVVGIRAGRSGSFGRASASFGG